MKKDFKENSASSSLAGNIYSKQYRNFVFETKVKRKVKVRGRPLQGRNSIDLDVMDIFLKNNHLLAQLRSVTKDHIHLFTSLKHIETTLGARKRHEKMITKLVTKLGKFRSSHSEVFLVKGVLKICSKFTGEHSCRSVISHVGMGVLLEICCIFSEHLLLRAPLNGCFCKLVDLFGPGPMKHMKYMQSY